jgi:MSHA pilin protein MshA
MLDNRNSTSKQSGFTLIELIVVIVILGILAAFALPRFVNMKSEANIAVLESIGGAILSAANLVHTKALVLGVQDQEKTEIDLDGDGVEDIEIRFGYPTASRAASGFSDPNNLFNAMESGFSSDLAWGTDAPPASFVLITTSNIQGSSGGKVNRNAIEDTNCYLRYKRAASAGASPTISYFTDGCY